MTLRSQMSLIMDLIGPELSKLSALEFENLPYLTLLYARRRWDVLCYHPWRTASPILCPEHISKTMLATVMGG